MLRMLRFGAFAHSSHVLIRDNGGFFSWCWGARVPLIILVMPRSNSGRCGQRHRAEFIARLLVGTAIGFKWLCHLQPWQTTKIFVRNLVEKKNVIGRNRSEDSQCVCCPEKSFSFFQIISIDILVSDTFFFLWNNLFNLILCFILLILNSLIFSVDFGVDEKFIKAN